MAAISEPVVVAIVGVLSLVGTLAAALLSTYASRKQSETTLKTAEAQNRATHEEGARDRFANWQVRKRDVYAEFLKAGRAYRETPTNPDAKSGFYAQLDRVMLVANRELRDFLWGFAEDPALLRDEDVWKACVEALGVDARQGKIAD